MKQNFLIKLRKLISPLNMYQQLKSVYFSIIPKGSKVYKFTHGFLSIFLKRIHFFNITYQEWIRRVDTLHEEDLKEIRKNIEKMGLQPHFSIIMPVYNTPADFLEEAIQSVLNQVYPYWELCIADDASTDPDIRLIINKYKEIDPKIRSVFRKKNGHISAASNSALELAQYPFAVLFDHDDILHPLALYYVAETINKHPDCEIIYSDEDKITKKGRRLDPYFKPDFNYELLLSHNMVSHLGVYRTHTMRAVGGFRVGLEGSQDYDLLLRIIERIKLNKIYHIPFPLYHWRISRQSAAEDVNIKPYAIESGKRAISEHLNRRSINAQVNYMPDVAAYQVVYNLPSPEPTAAIIIQDQDFSKSLVTCVEAILKNTNYPNYSIIIGLPLSAKGIETPFIEKWPNNVKIFYIDVPSRSYAKTINHIVSQIAEDFIVLLDKSLFPSSPDWLNYLIGQANQNDIGAVAPKLLFLDGVIYSSGTILLSNGKFHQMSKGEKNEVNGYFGWSKITRGYSALPNKCLVTNRQSFTAVGGIDENYQTPIYCGIDFCLRLKAIGLRNIQYPTVELYFQDNHNYNLEKEEQSIEIDRRPFLERWENWTNADPAFNPNLEIIDDGKLSVNLSPQFNLPGYKIYDNIP